MLLTQIDLTDYLEWSIFCGRRTKIVDGDRYSTTRVRPSEARAMPLSDGLFSHKPGLVPIRNYSAADFIAWAAQ